MRVDVYHLSTAEALGAAIPTIAGEGYDGLFLSTRVPVTAQDMRQFEASLNAPEAREIAAAHLEPETQPTPEGVGVDPQTGRLLYHDTQPGRPPEPATYTGKEACSLAPRLTPWNPKDCAQYILANNPINNQLRVSVSGTPMMYSNTVKFDGGLPYANPFIRRMTYNLSGVVYELRANPEAWRYDYLRLDALAAFGATTQAMRYRVETVERLAATALLDPDMARVAVVNPARNDASWVHGEIDQWQQDLAEHGLERGTQVVDLAPVHPTEDIFDDLATAIQVDGPPILPAAVNEVGLGELNPHFAAHIVTVHGDGMLPDVSPDFSAVLGRRFSQAVGQPSTQADVIGAYYEAYQQAEAGLAPSFARAALQEQMESVAAELDRLTP
jgi:hypothetical protein